MRIRYALTTCLLLAAVLPAATLPARAGMSEEDAVARVQSAGYPLVSKAEPEASGTWDVWASKDGIPYEVKVDSKDGSVIQAVPAEAND